MSTKLGPALVVALAAGLAPRPACAQSEGGEKVYQRALRGTVWIVTQVGENRYMTGSGALLDISHRLVVTNYHVVGDASAVQVLFPTFQKGKPVVESGTYWATARARRGIPARVLARDDRRDLALLELESVPRGAHALPLAREEASPGQRVHSIGNPGRSGALWVYTSGTVRTQPYHKRWAVREASGVHTFDARVFETQSPTNPGDSGGPLVNDKGELVGVTHGYAEGAQLLSLFIDVGEVRHLLASKHLVVRASTPAAAPAADEETRPTSERTQDSTSGPEHEAAARLRVARLLVDGGKPDKAKDRCREIIATYPKTQAAEEARLLLSQLEK
jgi:S1-C subfamily serine protease